MNIQEFRKLELKALMDIQECRKSELKAICRFIDTATPVELYKIVEEIRCCHRILVVYNQATKEFSMVESTRLDRQELISLNIEE